MTEVGPAERPGAHTTCLRRLEEYLGKAGVAYQVSHHPARFTAQELAEVERVPGRLVAKVVMVSEDDTLLMVIVPETARVQLPQVREAVGARKVRLASEREFEHVFPDCEVGAMPPFGNLYNVPVLVDVALTRDPVILFNAGSHDTMITMTYSDFARLAEPRTGTFARELAA